MRRFYCSFALCLTAACSNAGTHTETSDLKTSAGALSGKDYSQQPTQSVLTTTPHFVTDMTVDASGNIYTTGWGSIGLFLDPAGQVLHDLGSFQVANADQIFSVIRRLPNGNFLVFNPTLADAPGLAIYDSSGLQIAVLVTGEALYWSDVSISPSGNVVVWRGGGDEPTRVFDNTGHFLGNGPALFRPRRFDAGGYLADVDCDGLSCVITTDASGNELWRSQPSSFFGTSVLLSGDRIALAGPTSTELRNSDGALLAEWPAPADVVETDEVYVTETSDGGFSASWIIPSNKDWRDAYTLVVGPDGQKRGEFRGAYGTLVLLPGNRFLIAQVAFQVYDAQGNLLSTLPNAPWLGTAALTPSGDVIATGNCNDRDAMTDCPVYLFTFPDAE